MPPRRRAGYLLQLLAAGDKPPPHDTRVPEDGSPLHGAGEARAAGKTLTDPALLEEQLAIRERIEAARAAGDAAELARLAAGLSSRLAAIGHRLGELLAGDAPSVEARRTASRLLDEARLLERALELAQGGAELR